jgi:Ca2+-dependent lipid-binding protein
VPFVFLSASFEFPRGCFSRSGFSRSNLSDLDTLPAEFTMAGQQQQQTAPGGHYSGYNPVPTVKEFMDKLDVGKKDRDQELDSKAKLTKSSTVQTNASSTSKAPELKAKRGQKIVTDPVTGKDIVIENAKKSTVDDVTDPKLTVPNANLGKETTAKTDPSQSSEDYRIIQDITAPPAPMEPGSTTDVPIKGEKSNILFHPTPSVSYEPMFATLEKQAQTLCIGVFVGIIVVGRIFSARLIGLIPLAFCVGSGVFLWMKEVVRSGREVEWSSEKERGEHATANLIPESVRVILSTNRCANIC